MHLLSPQSGRSFVPFLVVDEVHPAVTVGPSRIARNAARSLNLPKTTVFKIQRFVLRMFSYWFQCIQVLQPGNEQLSVDFANFFLYIYDEDNK